MLAGKFYVVFLIPVLTCEILLLLPGSLKLNYINNTSVQYINKSDIVT